MAILRKKIGKQGTWPQALAIFFAPIFLIFAFRWILFEPFVIPSESMVPNLLVHDHILVKKFSYGIKPPWGDGWLLKYAEPKRGDVIVFRYPENRNIFYIKRLVGLPGDELAIQNGQITINGKPWTLEPIAPENFSNEETFSYYKERADGVPEHIIRLFTTYTHLGPEEKKLTVPSKSYFVMGDNRDQSQDSRVWGLVPEEFLVGKASVVWMSCEETLASAPFICDPFLLRSDRFFKTIK